MADETDPLADAQARCIRFTPAQAAWINHHLRNRLVLLSIVPGKEAKTVQEACTAIADAAYRLSQ